MSRVWKVRSPAFGCIRESRFGDWPHIYRIGRDCNRWPREALDDDQEATRAIKRSTSVSFLVIGGSDALYGYLAWGLLCRGTRAEVISLVIDPKYRRLGLGTRLMWRLGSQSQSRGFRRVMVTVDDHDDPTISFFLSVGMRAIGVRRGWFGEHDGYRFAISLEGGS